MHLLGRERRHVRVLEVEVALHGRQLRLDGQRQCSRRLWRRLARASKAVAGHPVVWPLFGSTEPPGAVRRALRRHKSRAEALPRLHFDRAATPRLERPISSRRTARAAARSTAWRTSMPCCFGCAVSEVTGPDRGGAVFAPGDARKVRQLGALLDGPRLARCLEVAAVAGCGVSTD
eukprot:scaffold7375_cov51-Phaeocystis_antarctica.AAC.2